jgi:hypothetical protein
MLGAFSALDWFAILIVDSFLSFLALRSILQEKFPHQNLIPVRVLVDQEGLRQQDGWRNQAAEQQDQTQDHSVIFAQVCVSRYS